MIPVIQPNSEWIYTGPNKNLQGLRHTVVQVSLLDVIAWSNPFDSSYKDGNTWRGQARDFGNQFRPATQ